MPKYDKRLAVEILKTITQRMERRANSKKILTAAEVRRKERAKKRAKEEKPPRPSSGIINDEDYGEKPKQIKLKDAYGC